MSVYAKFSRKEVRESLRKVLEEAASKCTVVEDGDDVEGNIVDTPEPEGQPVVGPVDMTGVKGAAAQAVAALDELVKQCSAVGMPGTDYSDMAAEIQAAFDLPGNTANVEA